MPLVVLGSSARLARTGDEAYVREAKRYVHDGEKASFYTVMRRARYAAHIINIALSFVDAHRRAMRNAIRESPDIHR